MFGIFDVVDDFIQDPIKTTVRVATQPVRDALEIVDGFSEGELRTKAALRLGADIAAGMAVSELVEWYNDNN